MDAKINHLTIRSEDAYTVGRFYEGFFHMRPTGVGGPTDDVHIGDGYIGLNIKPRLSGHPAQLDRFVARHKDEIAADGDGRNDIVIATGDGLVAYDSKDGSTLLRVSGDDTSFVAALGDLDGHIGDEVVLFVRQYGLIVLGVQTETR